MSRKPTDAAVQALRHERWKNTPWTQRIECPESGCTPARPLSDEVPLQDSRGLRIGEELNFHDADD